MKQNFESSITVYKAEDMVLLGQITAQALQGNETIFLSGELGSGKTTFAKGFGLAFEITEEIMSPTFVILREYFGKNTLYHYDFYRFDSAGDLNTINFFDRMGHPGIKLVEWADKFPEIKDYADWIITFTIISETIRQVNFYEG